MQSFNSYPQTDIKVLKKWISTHQGSGPRKKGSTARVATRHMDPLSPTVPSHKAQGEGVVNAGLDLVLQSRPVSFQITQYYLGTQVPSIISKASLYQQRGLWSLTVGPRLGWIGCTAIFAQPVHCQSWL